MLQISELYVYPVKSLGGIKVDQAVITSRGFQYDRRWMLVDSNNHFLSQRENAKMALLKVSILADGLKITDTSNSKETLIPFIPLTQNFIEVVIWDDTCIGQLVGADTDDWFKQALNMDCRLVYMPDESERFTSIKYTPPGNITSFADGYPFMMIGQESLSDLNSRLAQPLPVNRFRPNIVFTGGEPYVEDTMNEIIINGIEFTGVKLCARCNIPTINQETITKSKEPTKTLASYRAKKNNVYLGQNLISSGTGVISVGDELSVLSVHTEERFMV